MICIEAASTTNIRSTVSTMNNSWQQGTCRLHVIFKINWIEFRSFFFLIFVMFMMFVVAWCPVAQQRNAFAVADSDTVHMAVLYIRCTVCITHEVPSCRHTRLPVSHASIAKRHRSTAIFPVIHMHDWKCLRKCHSLRGDIKIREGTVSKPYIYIYMYTGYFRLAA